MPCVGDVNEIVPPHQPLLEAVRAGPEGLTHQFQDCIGETARRRDRAEELSIIGLQAAECRAAQRVRLIEDCVEYRHKVPRRGVDDPQHLGSRGLLLQRFARLGDEPRILH